MPRQVGAPRKDENKDTPAGEKWSRLFWCWEPARESDLDDLEAPRTVCQEHAKQFICYEGCPPAGSLTV